MRRTLLVVLALCASCDVDRAMHRRRDPGTLVVAQPVDVHLLDPLRVQDTESIFIGTLMFEGLVRWKQGSTDVQPALARAWEMSPDGKVWKFRLRPGVLFHDGTRLDAAAVVLSFDRLLSSRHPHYLATDDANLWRKLMKDVTRVVAIDAMTVEIRTGRPYAPLLSNLAMFPIVSPAAITRWGQLFSEHPVGTGPFSFENWRAGDSLIVRRFDRYWDKPALLERIVFRVVVDARQRLIDLESGSVDLAMSIAPDEQPFVELHPDLQLHHTPGNDISYLAFNVARQPFDNVRVRRALAHAVNKEPIVKLAFQGRAVPADGPLPPTQWAYHKPTARYPFDPVRAREGLIAAGFDLNATYTLYAPSTPRPYMSSPERVARFLQASLAQVGVKTELRLEPYHQFRDSVQAGEHDLALFGWVPDTGDPDNVLYVLLHSDNALLGAAHNIAFFRDPEVDRLLIEAQGTADVAGRVRLYAAAQERIADQCPWVPIAHSEFVVAARKEISGVVLTPLGQPMYARIRRESGTQR